MSQPVRLPSCDAAFAPSSRPGPGVVVLQTCKGDLSVERWAEICQTA